MKGFLFKNNLATTHFVLPFTPTGGLEFVLTGSTSILPISIHDFQYYVCAGYQVYF